MLRKIARSLIGRLPPGTAIPVLSGPMRGQRWIVAAGNNNCWLGTYELENQRLLKTLLRAGNVFYDVGAHSGLFTLLGARLVGPTGRVVAFEPNPANVASLHRHLVLNKLSNVIVMQEAVSNRPGRTGFTPAARNYMGRLDATGSLRVEVTTLDETLTQSHLPPPNIIKIDIEGAEVDALRGADSLLKMHHPIVLVETHSEELATQCRSFLGELGYSCRAIRADRAVLVFSPPGA